MELTELLDIGALTSAQREEVLQAAAAVAAQTGDQELAAYIPGVLQLEIEVREHERKYEAGKATRAQFVP